jgi:hypothetical protein
MAEKALPHDQLSLTITTINSMLSSLPAQLRRGHGLVGRTQARPGPTRPTLLIYQIAVNQNKTTFPHSRKLLETLTNKNIVQWRLWAECRILGIIPPSPLRDLHRRHKHRHPNGHPTLRPVSQTIDKHTTILTTRCRFTLMRHMPSFKIPLAWR